MSYNGWTNYETWNVALWLDNDYESYNIARFCKSFKQYRACVPPINGDGVSLYDKKLNIKELDDKIKELGAQLPSSFTFIAMLKLKINSENAAFDQEGQEVARILRDLADRLENLDKLQECQLPLRDLNGNTVGYYQTWTDQGKSQGAVISSPYSTWTNSNDETAFIEANQGLT